MVPSTLSSTCPPRLAGMIASSSASTSATASSTNGAQVGGFGQMLDLLQERGPEDAGRGRGDDRVEGVGAEQAPARDHPGPRPEGGADERVHRTRVVEVLAQPDEGVGHQQHADGRDQEGQRHRAARVARAALRVDVRGHARRHQRDRDADRRPHRQRTLQPRSARRARFHLLLLTVRLIPIVSLRPVRHGRGKKRNNHHNQQFPERGRLASPTSATPRPRPSAPVRARTACSAAHRAPSSVPGNHL